MLNSWWESGISRSADKVPTANEMSQICQELMPAIYCELDFNSDEEVFWNDMQNLLANVTKVRPFPNPISNFHIVIQHLHALREILKPTTVEMCCLYAKLFCPEQPGNWFIRKFLIVVSNPKLAIRCFMEMYEQKDSKFIAFMEAHGTCYRIFDLFLEYIENEEDYEIVQFTTRFLYYIVANLPSDQTRLKLAADLCDAINGIIESVPEIVKLNLVRYFTGTIDVVLECVTGEVRNLYIKRAFVLIKKPSFHRKYVLDWLFRKPELDVTLFTHGFNQVVNYDHMGYYFLEEMANRKLLASVAPCYARVMIQNKVWMRTAGHFLSNALSKGECTEALRNWFSAYIKYCFMFVKYAFNQRKYRGRALLWLTVITSESFMRVDWWNELVRKNARACLDEQTQILRCFIDGVSAKHSSEWNDTYALVTGGKYTMKHFPFKEKTTKFVVQLKKNSAKKMTPDKFLYRKDAALNKQQANVLQLQEIIQKERDFLAECSEKHIKSVCKTVHPNHRMRVVGCEQCIDQLVSEIRKIRRAWAQSTIDTCNWLIDAISKGPELRADATKVIEYYTQAAKQDPKIRVLRAKRAALRQVIENAQKVYQKQLTSISDSLRQILDIQKGSNVLDCIVDDWFRQSSLDSIRNGVLHMIIANVGKSLVPTLEAITSAIFKESGIKPTPQTQSRLYYSLVRMLFNDVYTLFPSILCQYEPENISFLMKCEELRRLGKFPSVVATGNLEFVCYCTNPIDIAREIYRTLETVQSTGRDKVMMAAAIIASSAPCNTVSIYRFLETWICLIQEPALVESVQLFLSACSMILYDAIVCK